MGESEPKLKAVTALYRDPWPELVEFFEQMTERARRGDVRCIAIVWQSAEDPKLGYKYMRDEGANAHTMIVQLDALKNALLDKYVSPTMVSG
jgi:hypothetical protein